MRTVIWNKLAKLDFYNNIEYLLSYWSEKEAQNFIDKTYDAEHILQKGNIDFQRTNHKNIRRLVVCKQITLFYKIIDKNTIEQLRFWNNAQDKLKQTF